MSESLPTSSPPPAQATPAVPASTATSSASTSHNTVTLSTPTANGPYRVTEIKLDPALIRDAQNVQREITTLLQQRRQVAPPKLDIQRVNQLDAEQLDKELNIMLTYQFKNIFKHFRSDLLTTYKPELDAFLHALIYRFSIYIDVATPGNILQNLCYTDSHADSIDFAGSSHTIPSDMISRRITPQQIKQMGISHLHRLSKYQKLWYFILAIGGRWAWARLQQHMTIASWGSCDHDTWYYRIYRLCRYMENTYNISSILNFIIFLWDGKYRSIIERILCMRLVYIRANVQRQVSYEFMNQQLVWHGFSEFLFFMLSCINIDRIRNLVYRFVQWGEPHTQHTGCPVCHTSPPCTPYVSSCGHIFCYYCLSGWMSHDIHYSCPICSQYIHSCEPYSVDKHGNIQSSQQQQQQQQQDQTT